MINKMIINYRHTDNSQYKQWKSMKSPQCDLEKQMCLCLCFPCLLSCVCSLVLISDI